MDDLKLIKKYYGEKMSHLCRDLFPTVLETPGVLYTVLSKKFYPNKFLYDDIIKYYVVDDFQNLIYDELNISNNKEENEEELNKRIETTQELLSEAGYILYECHSEEDIQKFKKYYAPKEELCTFRGGRLESCHVFFAVKKNVDKIKREDFKEPKREDEYGTSVMSIQFYKSKNSTVSIKNRYNHTVKNPDATYGNDLDRIITGLTQSFANLLAKRGIKLYLKDKVELKIPNYIEANDGKYYKYNMEINGIYYCPGNIIIDHGEVKKLKQEKERIYKRDIADLDRRERLTLKDLNTAKKNIHKQYDTKSK